MRGDVFISIGTPFTDQQKKFKTALLSTLENHQLKPRVIDETDFLTGQPLKGISKVLSSCSGAIIVAYERLYVDTGKERRLSPRERGVNSAIYSTPWNQIEAAMAYVHGMPILVICEEDLRQEGLLEEKFDWIVEKVPIHASSIADTRFQRRLANWAKDVEHYEAEKKAKDAAAVRPLEPTKALEGLKGMPLWRIFGAMTLAHYVTVITAVGFVLGIGIAVGRYLKP